MSVIDNVKTLINSIEPKTPLVLLKEHFLLLESSMKDFEFKECTILCPTCKKPLFKTHILMGDKVVLFCSACLGSWISS